MPAVWNRVLVVAVLAATAAPAVAADPPKTPPPVVLPLTLFDVLHMAQEGAKDDEILTRLRDTKSTFKLSPNDVSMLKLFGLSDRVVAAMSAPTAKLVGIASITGPDPLGPPAAEPSVSSARPSATPAPGGADLSRPVGTWVREAGPLSVRVTFTADRMTGEARYVDRDDEVVTITFDADYTVGRDGLLYGVLTGVDADDMDQAADLQMFGGHTFSARFRCEGGVLSVREVKFAGSGLADKEDDVTGAALLAGGRYRKDDGKSLAKPKLKKPTNRIPPTDAIAPPVVRDTVPGPDGQPIERLGIDFNRIPAPAVLPAAGTCLPPIPYPNPYPIVGGVPSPPPADPVNGSRAGAAIGAAIGTGTGAVIANSADGQKYPTGTWVREQNGVRVVLKLGDGRLKADVTFAPNDGDKDALRGTWRFDADCATGPDGMLLCVLTGVGMTPPDGLSREKHDEMATAVLAANKLVGEMFRFRTRPDDGELSVREFKLSANGGPDEEGAVALTAVFCGRYKPAEDKPLPPVKVGTLSLVEPSITPAPATCGGMTLPSSRYLKHSPQYYPPDPPSQLRQELDAMKPAEAAPMPRPSGR